MTLKNKLIATFPNLYQWVYERRTNRRVSQNRYASSEEMLNNLYAMYRDRMGVDLCLDPPKGYTEKIQWRKLHNLQPIYSMLSDKYEVRKWVAEKIGEEYLIPLLGVWSSFDDINFDMLPEKFVLKTNNASGTNLIVKNKKKLDPKLAKRKFDYWMKLEYWLAYGYEMQYASIEPKIIAEEFIVENSGAEDLRDYKFLCFDGKVRFVWVDTDRYHDHKRYTFYPDWTPAPFNQLYPLSSEVRIEKPENLDKMIELVEKLADGFDHVRVDLYDNNGRIYFGEMTFTNGSGFEPIVPAEWNEKLGDMWP